MKNTEELHVHTATTTSDVRKFAYDLAVANNCSFPESWNKRKLAGKDWLYGFISRNPGISLRQPEATSLSRAAGFNQVEVDKFFYLLRELYKKFHFISSQIYNVDETGMSTTQKGLMRHAANDIMIEGKIGNNVPTYPTPCPNLPRIGASWDKKHVF